MAELIINKDVKVVVCEEKYDYLCENKLKKENRELHNRVANSVVAVQMMLNNYKSHFMNYTDHTILHSIEVIDFANKIIGENIKGLNADEIYILLMAAYLHDSGMGISDKDFEVFKNNFPIDGEIMNDPERSMEEIIRIYHNEFSGEFIKKYAPLFDIPSKEHLFAIVQVSRGHRKTDLFDDGEYPTELKLPNGNTVCVAYLAALIRLADELDIAADRNITFLYDIKNVTSAESVIEFKKHKAIRHLSIADDTFYMNVDSSDKEIYPLVLELAEKLRKTLEECINVVESRTGYKINQKKIVIIPQ